MKYWTSFLFCSVLSWNIHAQEVSLSFDKKVSVDEARFLQQTFNQLSKSLPPVFLEKLPKKIEIKIDQLSKHDKIPKDVCQVYNLKNPFIYGSYNSFRNQLTLHRAVVDQLKIGEDNSEALGCQHGTLYKQAVAVIFHELSHAYDKETKVTKSEEFLQISGFKKGVFKAKSKNVKTTRSADPYELKNILEAFAVNFEYYIMDPEFACRRPTLAKFYNEHFGFDPHQNRDCQINNVVFLSTLAGNEIQKIDLDRLYRIDYFLASAGEGIVSGFGHSMFRLIMCAPEGKDPLTGKIIPPTPFGAECLKDRAYHLVAGYRANVDSGSINYIKGLKGDYPSLLFIQRLDEVLDQYNKDELRDIISYPLKLNQEERNDFIQKIIEEHWNYRGAYKFFTNNCAVESLDIIKSSLGETNLSKEKSITPVGVLKDLIRHGLVDEKDKGIEVFDAKEETLLNAYEYAYEVNKRKSDKRGLKDFRKFLSSSLANERAKKYEAFLNGSQNELDQRKKVEQLKKRLDKSASFGMLEQYVQRYTSFNYLKRIEKVLAEMPKEKMTEFVIFIKDALMINPSDITDAGYGIPLDDEINTDLFMERNKDKAEVLSKANDYLLNLIPKEMSELDKIEKNVALFSRQTLVIRREYLANLEELARQEMERLISSKNEELVIQVALGSAPAILELRAKINFHLLNDLSDSKIRNVAREIIN